MKFKVGDKVKFELDRKEVNPRVDLGSLNEGSGKYSEGIVKTVGGESDFAITYIYNGTAKVWKFSYSDASKQGFPTLIPNEEQIKGAEALKSWLRK